MAAATYEIIENHIYVFFSSRPDDKYIEMLKMRRAYYKKNVKGRKAWQLAKNSENLEFVTALIKVLNPAPPQLPDRLDGLPKVSVGLQDVLVRGNSLGCKDHRVTEYAGIVPVLTRVRTIENYMISLWYCADCRYYFVLDQTFQNLKTKGVILCKVTDYTTMHDYHPLYNIPSVKWNKVSPLRMCGYCVNQNEGLTDGQRHAILEEIIDRGILPKNKVMDYLQFFMNKLCSSRDAYDKWNADYNYIQNYNLHSLERKVIAGFFKL